MTRLKVLEEENRRLVALPRIKSWLRLHDFYF